MPEVAKNHSRVSNPRRLLRMPDVRERYPRCEASIYNDIKRGVFTPAIRLGPKCSAWPQQEVDAIIAARMAGKSDDEIRMLVEELLAQRKKAAA